MEDIYKKHKDKYIGLPGILWLLFTIFGYVLTFIFYGWELFLIVFLLGTGLNIFAGIARSDGISKLCKYQALDLNEVEEIK
jgi:hypothetical protein